MLFERDPLANPEALIERVYSYVTYRIGRGPEAEDLTGETFERAVRYRARFDPAKGTPTAWVLGIARRCVSDFLAGRPAWVPELPDAAAPGDLESETLERLELEAALATLGERDLELLSLRYGADLSIRRIAEILGLSPGTIRVGLHRARTRVRLALEPTSAPVRGNAFGAAPVSELGTASSGRGET